MKTWRIRWVIWAFFNEAVLAADPAVAAVLADPDVSLTVFAPEETLNGILTDQDYLTSILLYHVLDRRFDPRRVLNNRRILEPIGNIPPAEYELMYCLHAEVSSKAA